MTSARASSPDVVITHPNRDNAASKGMRAAVIAIEASSAILLFLLLIVSWSVQYGAVPLQILLGLLFAYFTYAVIHWRSGILPLAAGTAIVSGVFGAVSIASWYDRGGTGYDDPLLNESLIGVLLFAFVVLQFVNAVVALKAFTQNWHVELEVPRSEARAGAATAA